MTATDPTTLALTGQLPYILVTAAGLALPLAFFLLWLYRRALLRGMAGRSAAAAAPGPAESAARVGAPTPPPGPLNLQRLDGSKPSPGAKSSGALFRRARFAPWRGALVYAAGGLLFAAVMAFAFLKAGGFELLPVRFLLLLLLYAWPLVLTLLLVVPAQRRSRLLLLALYAGAYLLASGIGLLRSPDSSAGELLLLWASTNLPPTILLAVFLLRRVRAVGPLVVTFLVFAMTGTVVLISLLERNEVLLRAVAGAFFALGLGGTATFLLLHLLGFVLFGLFGWVALQWLRRRYQAKQANDQSLILDALWLLFGIVYAIGLTFEGALWILSGLVAFALYKTALRLGFSLLGRRAALPTPPRLLLLRVFSLGKRSETLFEAVSRYWRYLGMVQLISGPDLAAATVEPHEFLDFLTGKLERQFIAGAESLQRRLDELDTRADFDGRYRVNDFFCHDDTWKLTLGRLVDQSDVVLMDLRGFAPRHAGCAYELQALINTAPLDQVILVIDGTTDEGYLESTLRQAWQAASLDSPNRKAAAARLRLLRLEGSTARGINALLRQLCAAAEGLASSAPG